MLRPTLTALAAILVLGCGPVDATDPPETDPDTGSDSDTSPDSDSDSDSGTADLPDEALVRAAIASEGDPAALLSTVAWRGGWPVATNEGTWLVVADARVVASPHLAGDVNDWTPAPMLGDGDLRWLEIEADVGDGYKLVSDETWQADPWARAHVHDEFGELSLVGWPRDRWHLQRWPDQVAEGLAPRDVTVLVPPGEGPWPVLYAQDGQNLFDPGAPWGGWRMKPAVAALPAPILVVGIHNTPDRMAEYAFADDTVMDQALTAQGPAYAALVHDHVRPHIEATYGSSGHDGLLGSSMGGLAALGVALEHPGSWDFVASMSGTLGLGRLAPDATGPTMQERYLASPPLDLVVFVDSGGSDGGNGCTDVDLDGFVEDDPDDSDNFCTNRAFADALAAHGYTWGETLHHWHEPDAPHNEAAWAARVSRPLGLFVDLAAE